MFLVDTRKGRIVDDAEVKEEIAGGAPTASGSRRTACSSATWRQRVDGSHLAGEELVSQQRAFGYTFEDKRFILGPSAETGNQPLGSMGNDAPLAVLSDRPQLLYNYFRQLFAQVTNPAIDPIREELITASVTFVGSESDLLHPGEENCRMIRLETPIIANDELAGLRAVELDGFKVANLPILYAATGGRCRAGCGAVARPCRSARASARRRAVWTRSGEALQKALRNLFDAAEPGDPRGGQPPDPLRPRGQPQEGADPGAAGGGRPAPSPDPRGHPDPGLDRARIRRTARGAPLRGAARLRRGRRSTRGWRSTRWRRWSADGEIEMSGAEATKKYLKASIKGVVKTMSKMGISTVASYRGAQIFEAIGLNHDVIDKYFTWTASRVEGIGLDVISREVGDAPRRRVRPPRGRRRGARSGRSLSVAGRRRAAPVQPADDPYAAAGEPRGRLRAVRRVLEAGR